MAAPPPPTAIVLGVNGQDGVCLARRLAARGLRVVGIGRQPGPRPELTALAAYHAADLRDTARLRAVLEEEEPERLFHVAAVHGSAGTPYEAIAQDMLAVNVASLHECLEYARRVRPSARLVYLGSGKVFGPDYPRTVTEASRRSGSCLYTITKMAAAEMIAYYRASHGVAAAVAHAFNHESPLRPAGFFLPRVVEALRAARRRPDARTEVYTLDFFCDWGCADEYMELAIELAEQAPGRDVILATGRTWHARAFVRAWFARHGLDADRHLVERAAPGGAGRRFRIRPDGLRAALGRSPAVSILDVADAMLAAAEGMAVPTTEPAR